MLLDCFIGFILAHLSHKSLTIFMKSCTSYLDQCRSEKREVLSKGWIPTLLALVEYGRGNFGSALQHLDAISPSTDLVLIGGSEEQRDVFWEIKIDCMIRCGQNSPARDILKDRLAARPNVSFIQEQMNQVS